MLLETLVICALTLNSPFYDCSQEWTIFMWDTMAESKKHCVKWGTTSCADYNLEANPPIYGIINIAMNDLDWVDDCEHTLLLHEINHILYQDDKYCDAPETS